MLTFCKINLVRNIQCNQTTLTQHLNQACNYSRNKKSIFGMIWKFFRENWISGTLPDKMGTGIPGYGKKTFRNGAGIIFFSFINFSLHREKK